MISAEKPQLVRVVAVEMPDGLDRAFASLAHENASRDTKVTILVDLVK